MSYRNKDMSNILKHYVNCQSLGEIEFIEEQKKSGIKVCDRITHQRSGDGRDEIVIETQLSSNNDSSESSGNRACTLIKVDNSRDQSGSSLSNSDYYIKELKVSHIGKSKSLDNEPINRIREVHETHLTTVVGTKNKPFETVHKAVIEHSDSGRQLLQQNSFVRDATKRPSSYHSLPGRIYNSVSVPSTDKSNSATRTKSNKIKSWRSLFHTHKKTKKSHINTDGIDQLAKEFVSQSKEVKVEAKTMNSPMSLNCPMPFKSYTIGETLQPMKKKKKMPNFLRNMLSPNGSLPRTSMWPHKNHHDNNNTERRFIKEYTTNELDRIPVTRIVATISKDNDEEDFSYRTNAYTSEDLTLKKERYKSGPENTSNLHFDMKLSDTTSRRKSCPDKPCDCHTQRLDLMIRGLNSIIFNKKNKELINEFDEFDKKTLHLKKCPFNCPDLSLRKDSDSSSCHSHLSLYQSCEECNNVDAQLHPGISVHLLPLINRLEDDDEINFNDNHLQYFLRANCYKHFEDGMQQAIGFKCSIRNLAHLHYVTRKIVRHIGDPSKEDNEQIRRIMHFAEKFCADHYVRNIETHGSIEEFLKHSMQYDID